MTDVNDQVGNENLEDLWASALNESAELDATRKSEGGESVSLEDEGKEVFRPLSPSDAGSVVARDLDMVMDIPVTLSVELGRTRITIKQLLEMAQGSVIDLDVMAGDPMDIFINNHMVASGEVVVIDNKYGIRITQICTPSMRIQKLNRK